MGHRAAAHEPRVGGCEGCAEAGAGDVPEDEARDDREPEERWDKPVFVLAVQDEAGDPPAEEEIMSAWLIIHEARILSIPTQ